MLIDSINVTRGLTMVDKNREKIVRRSFLALLGSLVVFPVLSKNSLLTKNGGKSGRSIVLSNSDVVQLPDVAVGEVIHIKRSGSWEKHNCILKASHNTFNGIDGSLVLDVDRNFSVMYVGDKVGWSINIS
ncbi:MAG: hypothetical protein HN353_13565 [Bdellovibrionales bacterium]|nr:hypothetical protein [Bdellovibrionales bacterium]